MNETEMLLKNEVLLYLGGEPVKIILFGSRARKSEKNESDFDIGIIPYGIINKTKLIQLKYAVEEMNIPQKIDIVNFEDVSPEFKKQALKDAVIWKD